MCSELHANDDAGSHAAHRTPRKADALLHSFLARKPQLTTTLRLLRLTRIARVFKFAKYSFAVRSFFVAMSQSFYSLAVLTLVVFIVILLFGSCLYFAEDGVEHYDRCGNACFSSIASSCWSIISAVTTAGYGDSYPATALGKVIVSAAAFVGVVVLALPIAVFEDNFNKVYRARNACHKLIKSLTRHQDVTITAEVVQQWIDVQIMMGRFAPEEQSMQPPKGQLKKSASLLNTLFDSSSTNQRAPQGLPQAIVARDAIARLDAEAMVANYDVEGRGHLLEGEALMMIADVNEHHMPEDTAQMNAQLAQMMERAATSIAKSLAALEHAYIGADHASAQQKKVNAECEPPPMKGNLSSSQSSKSLHHWTFPRPENSVSSSRDFDDSDDDGQKNSVKEMDDEAWLKWTEKLESLDMEF